jgi:hypothetical protein
LVWPSSAEAGAEVKATVGATLFTCTDWVSVLPASPSESVACAETVEPAGPSGKLQAKLPLVSVWLSESGTRLPLAPQLVDTELTVSCPGSLIV